MNDIAPIIVVDDGVEISDSPYSFLSSKGGTDCPPNADS